MSEEMKVGEVIELTLEEALSSLFMSEEEIRKQGESLINDMTKVYELVAVDKLEEAEEIMNEFGEQELETTDYGVLVGLANTKILTKAINQLAYETNVPPNEVWEELTEDFLTTDIM